MSTKDTIVIFDFGSQFTQLIARRIRELNICSEIVNHSKIRKFKFNKNIKGIILSGGPSDVNKLGSPKIGFNFFNLNIPILGICYGHQLIVNKFGGKVKRANKEYGSSVLMMNGESKLLDGIGDTIRAWMSHGDEAEEIPENFEIIGHTENAHAAAIANKSKTVFGIQFHPEVVHTEQGTKILKNFVLNVCQAKQDWTMEGFIEKTNSILHKKDKKKK